MYFVNYLNDLLNTIITSEAFIVFAIAVLGYLIGGIRIKGIEIGTAGVLLVALVFGHFGFTVSKIVETIGIVLFVGSVGLIAGPKFFRNFKKNAKSYVLLGAIIILAGAGTCALIVLISGIDASLAAGLFSGALTSTPGFAAAKQRSETRRSAGNVCFGRGAKQGKAGRCDYCKQHRQTEDQPPAKPTLACALAPRESFDVHLYASFAMW